MYTCYFHCEEKKANTEVVNKQKSEVKWSDGQRGTLYVATVEGNGEEGVGRTLFEKDVTAGSKPFACNNENVSTPYWIL